MGQESGSALVADGSWRVERRLRYTRTRRVVDGMPQFGFHTGGRLYAVEFDGGWIGLVEDGSMVWTAGAHDPGLAAVHVEAPFEQPRFVAAPTARTVLACDARHVYRVDLASLGVTPLVGTDELGMMELGNCVPSPDGHLWVNDILGHQVLELTGDGRLVRRLGDGVAGFQSGTVGVDDVRFGWIYDLRCGPDGRIYVLDSTNYAVRVVDPSERTVTTICGDGRPGARGDGGPAVDARLGGDPAADFDGPWSLVVDQRGDIYVGDTHNHAVRRIDGVTGRITTVACPTSASPPPEGEIGDGPAVGPLFTKICGMDLDVRTDRLLIPDWVDDEVDELLVLARSTS